MGVKKPVRRKRVFDLSGALNFPTRSRRREKYVDDSRAVSLDLPSRFSELFLLPPSGDVAPVRFVFSELCLLRY